MFRGISFSNKIPAIQGSIDYIYNGWFAGDRATNYAGPNDNIEIDFYGGYANPSSGNLNFIFADRRSNDGRLVLNNVTFPDSMLLLSDLRIGYLIVRL